MLFVEFDQWHYTNMCVKYTQLTIASLCLYYLYHNFQSLAAVPTSQSEVTVMQSYDNRPRQDDESSQVEHTNGLYLCVIIA